MYKHLSKLLMVIINFLLLALVAFVIKIQDQKNSFKQESSLVSLPEEIINNQNIISATREEKLRNVNLTPKQTKTTQITTKTTTTTTTPTSSRTTRTS